MPEPVTTIGLSAVTAYLAKDGLNKLLGPTAEFLGDRLRELTERRAEAAGRIFENAYRKLGPKAEQAGAVPPRVLKEVVNEGSFFTESIGIEYMGGVLASSRTPKGRDDRGARVAKLVDRLSTYQMRTHYLVYATIKHIFSEFSIGLDAMESRRNMQIFAPLVSYVSAMDFTQEEANGGIISHIFSGLYSENLIEGLWQFGSTDIIRKHFGDAREPGVVCAPSLAGAELFLWAFGHGQEPSKFIFDTSFSARIEDLPSYLDGAVATRPAEARSRSATTS